MCATSLPHDLPAFEKSFKKDEILVHKIFDEF